MNTERRKHNPDNFINDNRKRKRVKVPWRFVITALLILIQVAITFVFMDLLKEKYIWLQIFFFALSALVLFFIMNKYQPASYKLPWVILILLMPLTGVFIYIAFAESKLPKKAKKRYMRDLSAAGVRLETDGEEAGEELEKISGTGTIVSRYIKNVTGMPVYKNCRCNFLNSGEKFFEQMKEDISRAEKYIFMEYFIVSSGSMLDETIAALKERIDHGVAVYILYDDIGSLKISHRFDRRCRKLGIHCYKFNPFHPVVTALHNNRDHRKIFVVDGKVAITGGANIADEYVNRVTLHGHWKDCAVRIEGRAVNSFVAMFVQLYNLFSPKPLSVGDFIADSAGFECGGYVQPFGSGPKPLYEYEVGQATFLNIINTSKEYVYITTPYFIVDYSVSEALANAALRGVDVRIITPHIPDKQIVFIMTRSGYAPLIKAGVKIYEYGPGFIHSKTIVCDDEIAFVGTINLDYRSFVHHYECGAVFIKSPVVEEVKEDFLKTISKDGIIQTEETARLTFPQKIIKSVAGLIAPLL